MAYLDLILRSITEPGLLKIFVNFLLAEDKFDGDRIIDVLIERLNSVDSRVSFSVWFFNKIKLLMFFYFLALYCYIIIF